MAILSRPVNQVFINFRGKDIRHGFVSHLKDALKRKNINFFIDTHEQKGRDLNHLFKRIEEATIALVILSPRYGESKWCLEELATIMDQEEKGQIIVIPIFYKVRTEDVEKQTGDFGHMFWSCDEEASLEEMEKWQVALKAVCNKIGLTLDLKRSEAKFIKKVLKAVEEVLTTIQSDEAKEGNCVEDIETFNVPLTLPWSWFSSAVELIGAILGLLAETVHADEGRREADFVKKVKTLNVPLALPWLWFGSAVELIGAVVGLLIKAVQSDERKEDGCVKKVKTFNIALALPWLWFGSAVELIGSVLGIINTVRSGEGREDDCVKKVKTFYVPLALPWLWFGSAVELVGAVLGLLNEIVHKCASPTMVILASQVGSVVAISSRWADKSV
ncbi:Toll/interleukin-1 receptor homology (TIR) domain [Arabidopsis suecica]|uniref:Toll/interleukin-1 receptor homology (TIR) domain n=1 Tax=Arabidopsis suecica TaxID=45249 RepID=A0A8T2HF34_ARASU|nr:Toll/interleukin-1 receptor homology (TIR) domain [Arabidopsis suecica]